MEGRRGAGVFNLPTCTHKHNAAVDGEPRAGEKPSVCLSETAPRFLLSCLCSFYLGKEKENNHFSCGSFLPSYSDKLKRKCVN